MPSSAAADPLLIDTSRSANGRGRHFLGYGSGIAATQVAVPGCSPWWVLAGPEAPGVIVRGFRVPGRGSRTRLHCSCSPTTNLMHPSLAFSPPEQTPAGPICTISWNGHPVATLQRTDTPEGDAWEPGAPGPVRVPGFTVYTVRSLYTPAVLSSVHRDAVLDELAARFTGTT
jgi:hypothetical protein